jgi:hypothetical protein
VGDSQVTTLVACPDPSLSPDSEFVAWRTLLRLSLRLGQRVLFAACKHNLCSGSANVLVGGYKHNF